MPIFLRLVRDTGSASAVHLRSAETYALNQLCYATPVRGVPCLCSLRRCS
jgi:hypothetical protein